MPRPSPVPSVARAGAATASAVSEADARAAARRTGATDMRGAAATVDARRGDAFSSGAETTNAVFMMKGGRGRGTGGTLMTKDPGV